MNVKMKRIAKSLPFVLVVLLLTATPVLAHSYTTPIIVTENNVAAYTQLPISATINNQFLANNAFINSTGLDTRVLIAAAVMPHMVADDRVLFSSAISQNSQTKFDYTFGNSLLTDFPIIVGHGGHITVPDSPSLELSNNFTVEQKGWIDTSQVGADLVNKGGAFRTYVSAAGSVTSAYIPNHFSQTLVPSAAGDYESWEPGRGAGTNWNLVDNPPGSPDDDGTIIWAGPTVLEDAYNLQPFTPPLGSTITSIVVYFRTKDTSPSFTPRVTPGLRLGGVDQWGTRISIPGGHPWTTRSQVISRPGGGSWEVGDLDALQVIIRGSSGGSATIRLTQIYVKVNYSTSGARVTATGVASGERTIRTTADGTNLRIFVDGIEKDSAALAGASVLDNANNWILMQNNSISYMGYYKHTVGGVLQAWYQPNTMIIGNTLPDRAGANNGIITWGANPAGISLTVGGLELETAAAPVTVEEPEIQTIIPVVTTDLFFESPGANIPMFYPLFRMASDNTGMPIQVFWYTFSMSLAALFGALALIYLRSMLVAVLATCSMLAVACTIDGGIIGWWAFYIYAITAITFVIYQKVVSV